MAHTPDEVWAGLTAAQKKAVIDMVAAFKPPPSEPKPAKTAEKPAAAAPKAKPAATPKKTIVKPKKSVVKKTPSRSKPTPSPGSAGPSSKASKPSPSPRKKNPVDPKLVAKWVGAKVQKDFDGTMFTGKVIRVHSTPANKEPGMEFYRIVYSDGDSEDVLIDELRQIAVD